MNPKEDTTTIRRFGEIDAKDRAYYTAAVTVGKLLRYTMVHDFDKNDCYFSSHAALLLRVRYCVCLFVQNHKYLS